ncbi:anti-CBASS protein Acb1 family protein [Pasteurella multocida]|uniref:anti-CBASS protein Acb1 family protein n=1 Tax=Pasteurella multocida TaxID=747 RepID=UPI001D004B52|nr:anti-CBASS Acb1 family protein [Pasteurella multocida]
MTKKIKIKDGLASLATNLGKKQSQLRYNADNAITRDKEQLNALWRENWIVQKICSKKARDMTRRWREFFSNDLEAEHLEKIEGLERKLKLKKTLETASIWASLYGGVAILVLTDSNTKTPLAQGQNIEKLLVFQLDKLQTSGERNNDVFDDNFGRYDFYRLNGEIDVHHSRLIFITGTELPLSEQNTSSLGGLSDIEPIYDVLKRYDALSANVGDLVQESKVDVFKMDGLTHKLSAGMEGDIAKAMSSIQLIKSSTNSLLIDKENDYEQKELTFSGLRDLLIEFRNAVAGAAEMPVTILFGQSVSGLASGDEDIQNYHESIHGLQESRLRPVFERLDPLLVTMAIGFFPEDWWFEFIPLKELSQEQQINMLNIFSNATNALIQNGVLTEIQVANELKASGLFTSISAEDIAQLETPTHDDEFTRSDEGAKETEDSEV